MTPLLKLTDMEYDFAGWVEEQKKSWSRRLSGNVCRKNKSKMTVRHFRKQREKCRLKWGRFRLENKWKQWISRFGKSGKLPAKQQLFILLLAGILLVVIVSPVPDQEEERIGTGAGVQETEMEGGDFGQEYEKLLEKRVESTLECVEGVGKVKVMITLKSSGEKVIEKDSQSEENHVTEEDSKGGSRSSDDQSVNHTSVYEQKSDGTQTPYVSKEMTPEIEGMVIAADGGDNPVVVKNLTEAVQALFGVDAHKIKIMKRTNV